MSRNCVPRPGVGFSWPKKWHKKWHENPHESPIFKGDIYKLLFLDFFIVTRAIFRAPFWPSESGMELEY